MFSHREEMASWSRERREETDVSGARVEGGGSLQWCRDQGSPEGGSCVGELSPIPRNIQSKVEAGRGTRVRWNFPFPPRIKSSGSGMMLRYRKISTVLFTAQNSFRTDTNTHNK